MSSLTRDERARKMVRDAVQWARNSGLSNKDAQAEAATLFGLTSSRVWTLLYKPETVREIAEGELSKIEHCYLDVLSLQIATTLDLREHMISMAAALRQEDKVARLPFLRQSQSLQKRPCGQPLWQDLGPCKRPRKARA
jgi:hypothetical protein